MDEKIRKGGRKMKKGLLLGILFLLGGILISWQEGSTAPLIMRFSSGLPENQFIEKEFIEWGNMIEQNSKGALKVQFYHSAQLYRDHEVIKSVQTGALDSGNAYTMYLESQLVPAVKVYQLPFLFRTMDEAIKAYRSEIGETMRKTAEQKGVKLLAMVCWPSPEDIIIATTKPVKSLADIKGMVIRAVSPESSAVLKKWGAGPSFITGAEVYMALQRGTINGAIMSLINYHERKMYEVAPHAIFLPIMAVHSFIVMNKGFFDRLSPEQQRIIQEASKVAEKNSEGAAMKALEEFTRDVGKKSTLYRPTATEIAQWREGLPAMWGDLLKGQEDALTALKQVRSMLNQ
jgi:TRAP-type C4-dicarboxylate transport system substrate-binding protein